MSKNELKAIKGELKLQATLLLGGALTARLLANKSSSAKKPALRY
jgi:hypothetical protein